MAKPPPGRAVPLPASYAQASQPQGVAIACAGLFPSGGPLACLIASLAVGLLFASATASTLPMLTRWMMPLLSLAGGGSVAFTLRRDGGTDGKDPHLK
ncbi:MAG TPA: hypothetical protein VHK26_06245 [Methyloceanibacter sp.]|jgi:hypothetical protein|nr:hypothetical protein [Methyloceanibacter sp.]